MYFCKVENFAYGEINERSFSNPHPLGDSLYHVELYRTKIVISSVQVYACINMVVSTRRT